MIRKTFKIGLIQLDTQTDLEAGRLQAEQYIKEAKEAGAELVILPEHSDAIGKRERDYSCTFPGEVSEWYAAVARKYEIYLHCGSITEENSEEEGKPYNTTVLFSPQGNILKTYRKMHLFDVVLPNGKSVKESSGVSAGKELAIADTDLCTLGLTICYDLRFPELYRLLALEGADLLVVSANFTAATGCAHWEPLLRARAIENSCYVAAVNQCGEKALFKAWGHTMLIDPWGRIVGELDGENPGLLIGTIDPAAFDEARGRLPFRENRRTDVYELKRL